MTAVTFTDLERALEDMNRDPAVTRALEDLLSRRDALLAPVLREMERLSDPAVLEQLGFGPLPPPDPPSAAFEAPALAPPRLRPAGVYGSTLEPDVPRRRRRPGYCPICEFRKSLYTT